MTEAYDGTNGASTPGPKYQGVARGTSKGLREGGGANLVLPRIPGNP